MHKIGIDTWHESFADVYSFWTLNSKYLIFKIISLFPKYLYKCAWKSLISIHKVQTHYRSKWSIVFA
jgi:hypothetical protein